MGDCDGLGSGSCDLERDTAADGRTLMRPAVSLRVWLAVMAPPSTFVRVPIGEGLELRRCVADGRIEVD